MLATSSRVSTISVMLYWALMVPASAQTVSIGDGFGNNSAIAKQALAVSGRRFAEDTPEFSASLRSAITALNPKHSQAQIATDALKNLEAPNLAPLDNDPQYRRMMSSIVHAAAKGDPNKILTGQTDGPVSDPTQSPPILGGSGGPPQQPGSGPTSLTLISAYNASTHYPNVVFLWDTHTNFCSGVAIAKKLVLTAAHCVCDYTMRSVGVGVAKGRDMQFTPITHTASMAACGASGPDVAIVETQEDVYDPNARAAFASAVALNAAGSGVAVGYGNRDVGDDGGAMDGQRGWAGIGIMGPVGSSQVCDKYGCNASFEFATLPLNNLLGVQCMGDSGGPLYIKNGKTTLLAGIAARAVSVQGTTSLGCGHGGIYERVDGNVSTWINGMLAKK